MISKSKNLLIKLITLVVLTISTNSYASTICSLNCPDTGTGTGGTLPAIFEIFSSDGSDLTLETNGLIILDESIFSDFSNLTINSLTPVYQGLSELPSSFTLPDVYQLNSTSYTGGASFLGLENDILLRQFDVSTLLDLTASNGILIMDTTSLFAVPLPGAVWLFLSGLISFFYYASKKP